MATMYYDMLHYYPQGKHRATKIIHCQNNTAIFCFCTFNGLYIFRGVFASYGKGIRACIAKKMII